MKPRVAGHVMSAAIFAYFALSAALWVDASWWLHSGHESLWCGNRVGDPYMLLVNVVGPFAGACAAGLTWRCLKAHRWPPLPVAAILAFAVTSACLAYEGHVLPAYGIEVQPRWWPPWSVFR